MSVTVGLKTDTMVTSQFNSLPMQTGSNYSTPFLHTVYNSEENLLLTCWDRRTQLPTLQDSNVHPQFYLCLDLRCSTGPLDMMPTQGWAIEDTGPVQIAKAMFTHQLLNTAFWVPNASLSAVSELPAQTFQQEAQEHQELGCSLK